MKEYIIASASSLLRVLSLMIQGYLFGSRFARFEFRRSFLREWLDSLGGVGAWCGVVLCTAFCGGVLYGALYGLLWLGYILGFTM